MKLADRIAGWIKEQIDKANKKGIVVGLSGGIDSATVAVLAKKALADKVLGLILPCHSDSKDEELAIKLASLFDILIWKVSLNDTFEKIVQSCPEGSSMARANLKPRLRMAVLYYFANTLDYLVAGTGNKSELTVGYFTKYGDGGVDILPLGGLLKTEVRDLANDLGIPQEIIDRAPSAGLWQHQTDEAEMGITYEQLDRTIKAIELNKTDDTDRDSLYHVKRMMQFSEHKRNKIQIFSR